MNGVIHVLDSSGDFEIRWQASSPEECEKAREQVAALSEAGYSFFLIDGTPADTVAAGVAAGGVLNCRRVPVEEVMPAVAGQSDLGESDSGQSDVSDLSDSSDRLLSDARPALPVRTYAKGGKGKRQCPACSQFVGNRVPACACGHSFAAPGAAVSRIRDSGETRAVAMRPLRGG